jgi:hypothetical protein
MLQVNPATMVTFNKSITCITVTYIASRLCSSQSRDTHTRERPVQCPFTSTIHQYPGLCLLATLVREQAKMTRFLQATPSLEHRITVRLGWPAFTFLCLRLLSFFLYDSSIMRHVYVVVGRIVKSSKQDSIRCGAGRNERVQPLTETRVDV